MWASFQSSNVLVSYVNILPIVTVTHNIYMYGTILVSAHVCDLVIGLLTLSTN